MCVSHALGSSVSLFPQAHAADRLKLPHQTTLEAVSYTHLTLPTKRIV